MIKTIIYYLNATFIITFSKDFKSFEKEYTQKSPEQHFQDAGKTFTEKEKKYLDIIHTCYVYF